jgi:threonine/homoserine/homoserine lactone efflux protein
MAEGISAVLGFAVGVAISPVPIIAVILMLFSRRARANGVAFAVGWVLALSVVSVVSYLLAVQGADAAESTTVEAVAWGKVIFGVLFLALAVRNWRSRPAPGEQAPMPKWMAGIDSMAPGKALVLGLLLAGVNPKNLMLSLAAGTAVAGLMLPTTEAAWSLVVFVVVASLTIVLPVGYYLVGGAKAKASLDNLKDWLAVHNNAVMAVLLLVFGVDLIAKGLPPLF